MKIAAANDAEAQAQNQVEENDDEKVQRLKEETPAPNTFGSFTMEAADFEKVCSLTYIRKHTRSIAQLLYIYSLFRCFYFKAFR